VSPGPAPRYRIAIIGTRGIPARYGGWETFAEELATRLVARGHDVTVYCRPGNADGDPPRYQGVHLVYTRSIDSKRLGSVTQGLTAILHAMRRDYDCIHVMNVGNSLMAALLKLRVKAIAYTVDGLDWQRPKWGPVIKAALQLGELVTTKVATELVTDSKAIQAYYRARYRRDSTFIAYGANVDVSRRPEVLKEYDLERDDYFFVASRLEPENNADLTVRAFEGVATTKKLVIAGGANYRSEFIARLRSTRDPRVRFLGPVYQDGHIQELHCNCFAYVHGNEVGGTNPALLKAMAYGNAVIGLDVPYNAEVLDGAGLLYQKSVDDLRAKIRHALDHPEVVARCRARAVERIREAYTWDHIVDEYERVYGRVVAANRAP
jgi:glycosyltransferase involved in cell wall biosynthesis